jgi:glycerol-3-phosphate acyltransferase PlsY
MNDAIKYILIIAVSYLLGSLNFSIIISKYANGSDIRGFGSGNAGITNYLRSFGARSAFTVIAGDMLKCIIAVVFAGWLLGFMGKLVAGIFVMLGHMFPVYFGFKGGKGVLTTAALILTLDWRIFLIGIGIFFIVVLITKYVSLGSVLAVTIVPIFVYLFYNGNWWFFGAAVLIAAIVVFMHRTNIKRLLNGTETKFKMKK